MSPQIKLYEPAHGTTNSVHADGKYVLHTDHRNAIEGAIAQALATDRNVRHQMTTRIAKLDAELCERTEEVEHVLADLNNALAELAVRDNRIATLEFELEVAKTDELSAAVWAATETIKGELWDAQAELAASREQVPFAWSEFDGEGGYDFRLYEDSETFRDDFIARNGGKYADWVRPLYAAPAPAVVLPPRRTKADYSCYIGEFANEAAAIHNAVLDEVTRLNPATASPVQEGE